MERFKATSRHSLCFHRSPKVLLVEFIEVVLPLSLLYYVFLRFPEVLDYSWTPDPRYLAWGYRLICVLWFLVLLHRYYNDLYVFGQRRVMHFAGRLSFRYLRISICYTDIREIKIEQSILGRLLDYGTLEFSTAAGPGEEIKFYDIGHPHKLAAYTQRLIGLGSNANEEQIRRLQKDQRLAM